jgi:hypothetical protein
MSNCDCLARLERALERTVKFNRTNAGEERYHASIDVLDSVRAAQRDAETTAPGVGNVWLTDQTYDRLRAWEKWAREVAVPALEEFRRMWMTADQWRYGNWLKEITASASDALASRPKERET